MSIDVDDDTKSAYRYFDPSLLKDVSEETARTVEPNIVTHVGMTALEMRQRAVANLDAQEAERQRSLTSNNGASAD